MLFVLMLRNFYVRADKVFHLRHLLDKSSSVQGLMSEEKGRCLVIHVLYIIIETLSCVKCSIAATATLSYFLLTV